MKRIVLRAHLQNKMTLGKIQNGSREFISLLITIYADGTTLPFGINY